MAKLTKAYIDRIEFPPTGYALHWDDTLKVSTYGSPRPGKSPIS